MLTYDCQRLLGRYDVVDYGEIVAIARHLAASL